MPGEWPIGDELTWREGKKAMEIDKENPQDVANTIVRHVNTSLGRQVYNVDEVGEISNKGWWNRTNCHG